MYQLSSYLCWHTCTWEVTYVPTMHNNGQISESKYKVAQLKSVSWHPQSNKSGANMRASICKRMAFSWSLWKEQHFPLLITIVAHNEWHNYIISPILPAAEAGQRLASLINLGVVTSCGEMCSRSRAGYRNGNFHKKDLWEISESSQRTTDASVKRDDVIVSTDIVFWPENDEIYLRRWNFYTILCDWPDMSVQMQNPRALQNCYPWIHSWDDDVASGRKFLRFKKSRARAWLRTLEHQLALQGYFTTILYGKKVSLWSTYHHIHVKHSNRAWEYNFLCTCTEL